MHWNSSRSRVWILLHYIVILKVHCRSVVQYSTTRCSKIPLGALQYNLVPAGQNSLVLCCTLKIGVKQNKYIAFKLFYRGQIKRIFIFIRHKIYYKWKCLLLQTKSTLYSRRRNYQFTTKTTFDLNFNFFQAFKHMYTQTCKQWEAIYRFLLFTCNL